MENATNVGHVQMSDSVCNIIGSDTFSGRTSIPRLITGLIVML